jgi:imidazolonepropionase-like amidohydrolase
VRKLIFALVAAGTLAVAADSYLIRGVTIHPVTQPDIPNGSILIQDGSIAALGAKVAAPRGVHVIDGKGLYAYPGMIDSATEIGVSEVGSVRETNDTGELGEFNPQLRIAVAINPASEHIPVTRANGITSVITMPGAGGRGSTGVITGQAALIHLDGWTPEDMAMSRSAAMQMVFPIIQTKTSRFPDGLTRTPYLEAKRNYDKRLREMSDFFEQARRYQQAKAALAPGFKEDLKYEAMLPVLDGKLPVMVIAERERAIREAIAFAGKQKIRIVLAGMREPGSTLADLKAKGIPVIAGPTLALPLEEDDSYDAAFTLRGELFKAGIQFAFGTFNTAFSRNLPYQAAAAVAFGLPREEALKAVTINAARIWGAGDQIGSLEKGKWADLILTDGDPVETRTQVKRVWIRGRDVDLSNKHTRLYEKYLNRP